MNPEERVLLQVIREMDALGIPYMLAGSLASSHHGRPRSTQDADIVFDPTPQALDQLVHRLIAAGFYVDAARAQDALRRRWQFNIVDPQTAWKIDLIVLKARPFSREEFSRRMSVEMGEGVSVSIATPEDTILAKLEWAKASGGSEKQMSDVAGVLEANPNLDRAYIERWAAELDIVELLRNATGR